MDYEIFNSHIWKTKLYYEGKEELIKKIKTNYEKQPNLTPKKWRCDVHSSFESEDNTDFFMIGESNLLDNIESKIREFLSSHGPKMNLHGNFSLAEIWYNAYKDKQFQEPHDHGEYIFSGCYYLKFDKDTHYQTQFYNPNFKLNYSKLENNSYFCFSPDCEEDDLIIFPSGLKHGTLGVKSISDDIRITISFNIAIRDYMISKKNTSINYG